jgi:hypothetical protein
MYVRAVKVGYGDGANGALLQVDAAQNDFGQRRVCGEAAGDVGRRFANFDVATGFSPDGQR